jgi:hypothetical protein
VQPRGDAAAVRDDGSGLQSRSMTSFKAARPEAASRLRHRPLFRADVAECIELLPPWLGVDAAQRPALRALWERWADDPAVVCGVQEDLARPPGERVQSWGATLIMPADWLDALAPRGRYDSARGARVCRDTYDALLAGRLQLPSERDIGRSNAGDGIVFFALHYRQRRHDMSDPYAQRVLNLAHEAFRTAHAGYHVRAFVQQALLSDEPWLAGGGFKRRTDPLPGLSAERQTVLYGITREEAAAMLPGSSARHVFEHQPPRFRFSAPQRRLLKLALFDEGDEHLMQQLDVSVHGLKKLWRGIYERINDVEPEFFGEPASADDGKRGPEKRRQVLAHVRQRPEELRPWLS